MHEFWATVVIRIYITLITTTFSVRLFRWAVYEPETRTAVWALRIVLLVVVANWVGVL